MGTIPKIEWNMEYKIWNKRNIVDKKLIKSKSYLYKRKSMDAKKI